MSAKTKQTNGVAHLRAVSSTSKKTAKKTSADLGVIGDDAFVLRFGQRGISMRFADEERTNVGRHIETLTYSMGMLIRALGYVPVDASMDAFDRQACLDGIELLAALAHELASRAQDYDEAVTD